VCSVIDNYIQDLEQEWLAERAAHAPHMRRRCGNVLTLLRDARRHRVSPASGHDAGLLLADSIERIDAALSSPAKMGDIAPVAKLLRVAWTAAEPNQSITQ